jgi:hypothetical protein
VPRSPRVMSSWSFIVHPRTVCGATSHPRIARNRFPLGLIRRDSITEARSIPPDACSGASARGVPFSHMAFQQ